MEKIINYRDLNKDEKLIVYEFIKLETKFEGNFDNMEETFNEKIYDYGKGVLFYFRNNKLIASLCIVLEVTNILGTAYIHKINVDKKANDVSKILKSLINKATEIAREYGAKDIRIGISEDFIIKEIKKINIIPEYKSIEMNLKDQSKKHELLSLKKLNEINKYDYIQIYNDSFSDMPHGTIITIDRVNDLLENKNNKLVYFYIVYDENKEIGFMEVTIEHNKGMFDIGLCKKYRGQGYGKRLLETAIQFLVDKKVEEIVLIVIEENKVAYNMYKDRGFTIKNIMGQWCKI